MSGGGGAEGDASSRASLRAAIEAIDGLTKLDVAEIRTMVNPPAAVEVVLEAVMVLLTGKMMTFQVYRQHPATHLTTHPATHLTTLLSHIPPVARPLS